MEQNKTLLVALTMEEARLVLKAVQTAAIHTSVVLDRFKAHREIATDLRLELAALNSAEALLTSEIKAFQ